MAELFFTKRYNTGNLASGASYEQEYVLPEDAILERIYIQATDGSALSKSLFQLQYGNEILTRDDAPALIFGPTIETNDALNLPVAKNEAIRFVFKNLEAAAKEVYITLKFVKR